MIYASTHDDCIDLVGTNGDDAVTAIKNERPELTVQKLNEGAMVTMDFKLDRVRVFVDTNGNVARKPKLG
jgi:hypothetical protein